MADEIADRPRQLTVLIVLQTFQLLNLLMWLLAAVGIVYFGVTVPIRETAGQETVLNVGYRTAVDMDLHVVLPYAAVALFFWLWRKERNTRIDAVARENRRNKELEMKIDPGRTSSGLQETSQGGV